MRLHLVDGTFELFRAHFSPRPGHVRPDGKPFKATSGLIRSLLALLHDPKEAVSHLAIAFDNPIRSFRNDLFPAYKSDEGIDPELRAQFHDAEAAAAALGVVVWRCVDWEADDALATAAVRFADAVDQVRILTPDKDLGQVVRDRRIVQVDRIRDREIDEAQVRALRGVPPASVPDLLALTGDTADGIPGLPGWGEKSTAAVLARYGHIEHIPDDPKQWDVDVRGAKKLAAWLAANREAATLFRTLATLKTDVPLAETLDDLRWRGAPRERWRRWCESVGLASLADRPKRWSEA